MKTYKTPTCPEHGFKMEVRCYKGQNHQGITFFACPYVDNTTGNECDWRVGRHPDGSPKGTPADLTLRQARITAHKTFDQLWSGRNGNIFLTRKEAYKWLSETLNIPYNNTHIGYFDEILCQRVVEACHSIKHKD